MSDRIPDVTEAVKADLDERTERGLATYGCSLAEAKLTLRESLQHSYEETLDQAQYLKTAILTIDAQEEAPEWIGVDYASEADISVNVRVEVPINLEVEITEKDGEPDGGAWLFQDINDAFDLIRRELHTSAVASVVIRTIEQE